MLWPDPFYNFLACGTDTGSIHVYDAQSYTLVDSFEDVVTGGQPVSALIIGSGLALRRAG